MAYFTQEDFTALQTVTRDSPDILRVKEKMRELHEKLYAHIRNTKLALFPFATQGTIATFDSTVNALSGSDALSLIYYRGDELAVVVERLMGRELDGTAVRPEARRHPVIEARISPNYFTVELVLSPDAWWDQRNLVGKLSIDRHRSTFFKRLHELGGDYSMGFWGGTQLGEMHLSLDKLSRVEILMEWMGTFAVRKDWFRVGIWYPPDHPMLESDTIANDVFRRMRALHDLYLQILWSGDNNFQAFYQGDERTRKP